MKKKVIIGVCGLAGSGKDEFADVLVTHYKYEKRAFAKPLKDAIKTIFGWDDDHVYGILKEVVDPVYGVSPRIAMQKLGTEWRDMINRDLWVIRMREYLNSTDKNHIVIPDVRFNHEAQMLYEEFDAIIYKIEREGLEPINNHASEQGIDDKYIETVIHNDSTLEAFRSKCHKFSIVG